MAWNEPGKDKDPWGNGSSDQGPPDLDEIARNLQRRLRSIFGGGGGGSNRGSASGGGVGGFGAGIGIAIAAVLWLLSGFYKVDDAERGVVLRFGEHVHTTNPGLHWHLPFPIETLEKVNVASIDKFAHQTRMLTADENIVAVDLAVQYRRANPSDYLFNVADPIATLSEISESAIREVVGKNTMDFVLREGRAAVSDQTKELIQLTLDQYGTGIQITSVNLQDANFPNQVQAAVQDAIKAREDKERQALEAQAYANDIVPRARGLGAAEIQGAEAHRSRAIAIAEGEAARFAALLAEYEKAPRVTRERLYLESMEEVYANSSKVLLPDSDGGSLIYLPLDKLLENQPRTPARDASRNTAAATTTRPGTGDSALRSRENLRSRGNR